MFGQTKYKKHGRPATYDLKVVKKLRTVLINGWKSYELDVAMDMLDGKMALDYKITVLYDEKN
ncbi:MAG: hypothetical protein Q7R92_05835 [bacterium]|nr:hypothetical protein [bacterium]